MRHAFRRWMELNNDMQIWRLVAALLGVYALWFGLESMPPRVDENVDPWILTSLFIGFGILCAATLIFTGLWTWMGVALLLLFAGDTCLYLWSAGLVRGWPWVIEHSEQITDLARACFIIGIPMAIIGVPELVATEGRASIRYRWNYILGRDTEAAT